MNTIKFQRKNKEETLRVDLEQLAGGNCLPLLRYPLLEQTGFVEHGFTTRLGGVSQGIFESLNLSFTRGDEPEAVRENYRRVAEALHVDYEKIVCSDQTHTTNVRVVTKADAGNGVIRERSFTDIDGMITNVPGLVLATFYADCVPLYFVDPVRKAIGLSHSGWRGTVNRMGRVTIEAMTEHFGSDPKDLICAIGPSICQDCYEISGDVAKQFILAFPGWEKEILQEKGNDKYQLDLWRANEIVLREAGILAEHLSVTDICTCCNKDLLFSHRASHGKRGNLGAFLAIRETL